VHEYGHNFCACDFAWRPEFDIGTLAQPARAAKKILHFARTARAMIAELMEKHPVGIWIIDPAGKTIYASERLVQLLGTPRSELVGKPLFTLVFPKDLNLAQRLLDAENHDHTEPFHIRLRRNNGLAVGVDVRGTPMHNAIGLLTGIIITFSVSD
jgi:PAS domain S-box-containing protein